MADQSQQEQQMLPPPAPPVAAQVFDDRLDLAARYVAHLASTGISHGLVGPREVPRIWERHVLNCAVVSDLLEPGTRVADVGSGAGLPGLVLAIRRADVHVTLVEPLLRRVTWLQTVVDDLELTNVTVTRARAEDLAGTLGVPVVTARAVAPLDRLARWSLPLLQGGGRLLAMKGESAAAELAEHEAVLRGLGVAEAEIILLGDGVVADPVRVVAVRVGDDFRGSGPRRSSRSGGSRSRARDRR